MKFYQLDNNSLEKELDTNLNDGLTKEKSKSRFEECGYNIQTNQIYSHTINFSFNKTTVLVFIIALIYFFTAVFKHDFLYVYYGIGMLVLTLLFSIVIRIYHTFINNKIYKCMINDYGTLTAIRDGKEIELQYNEVMYGDVVLLKKGDYIPFDARIIECESLVTDERNVTSIKVVEKQAGIIEDENINASKLFNMVFCGSYVSKGNAKVVVTDIGKRVYIARSKRNEKLADKYAPIINTFTKILSLVLVTMAIVFTVISGLISTDYISLITLSLMWVALFVTDFFSKYITLAFTIPFVELHKRGIYLKSPSMLENINNINIMLLNRNLLLNDTVELTGFVTDDTGLKSINEVNKSNFGVFLYSAFCSISKNKTSYYNSTIKILNKVGIDYAEIESICPVVSHYSEPDSDFEISGRVYDGNNLIMVKGELNRVLAYCNNNFSKESYLSLSCKSTDIIAVAIKKVNIIPDDLLTVNEGFELVGLIGINCTISANSIKMCNELERRGVKCVTLFSGDKRFAANLFSDKQMNIVSAYEIDKFNEKELKNIDIICDYDGNVENLINIYKKNSFRIGYVGDKKADDKKSVAFKSSDFSHYDNIKADVVSKGTFNSIFEAFNASDKCAYAINKTIENVLCFAVLFIVVGVLFSILNASNLINVVGMFYVFAIAIFISSAMLLHYKRDMYVFKNRTSFLEPISINNIISVSICCLMFIILSVVLKFTMDIKLASSFILLTFVAYLPRGYVAKFKPTFKRSLCIALSFLPALVLSIILSTPIAFLFETAKINFFFAMLAICVGVIFRITIHYISISVKN